MELLQGPLKYFNPAWGIIIFRNLCHYRTTTHRFLSTLPLQPTCLPTHPLENTFTSVILPVIHLALYIKTQLNPFCANDSDLALYMTTQLNSLCTN
jgi:hypothetical protein